MSNSPLVSYTRLSPNHSGPRTKKIDMIAPHCVVGHLSLETIGNIFANPNVEASSNYAIDDEGRKGLYVPEDYRSWCTSSEDVDQRAVTIEIACDPTHPYAITDKAMQGLIELCVDICKRNGIPKLLWRADKSLLGQVDKQNIAVHRWTANKACPGDYIYSRLGYVADEVNKILLASGGGSFFPYRVRIDADSVEYIRELRAWSPVGGVVHRNEIYTIVEEGELQTPSAWGKLKSGAGWIPLKDCTPNSGNYSVPYTVKINTDTLQYRRGAGINNPVAGTVRRNEVYTIIDEANAPVVSKWGRLKSGAGWIPLQYCEKLG